MHGRVRMRHCGRLHTAACMHAEAGAGGAAERVDGRLRALPRHRATVCPPPPTQHPARCVCPPASGTSGGIHTALTAHHHDAPPPETPDMLHGISPAGATPSASDPPRHACKVCSACSPPSPRAYDGSSVLGSVSLVQPKRDRGVVLGRHAASRSLGPRAYSDPAGLSASAHACTSQAAAGV